MAVHVTNHVIDAWPNSEHEFLKLVETVERELQTEQIPILHRPISACDRISAQLSVPWDLTQSCGSPSPNNYRGDNLFRRIVGWYEQRYGDRIRGGYTSWRVCILLRGDTWSMQVPRMFGSIQVVCEPDSQGVNSSNHEAAGRHLTRYNILDRIDGLTPVLRCDLTLEERTKIHQIFLLAYTCMTAMDTVHEMAFVTEALADLDSAIFHLLGHHRHCGLSKWASLMATEKMLKAFTKLKTGEDSWGHRLDLLAVDAERAGLTPVDKTLLSKIQCEAKVRYGEERVSLEEALAAHHASLEICGKIAREFLSEAERDAMEEKAMQEGFEKKPSH